MKDTLKPGIESEFKFQISKSKLVKVDGRRLVFEVEAYDDIDMIAKGKLERFVINKEKFDSRIKEKISKKGK